MSSLDEILSNDLAIIFSDTGWAEDALYRTTGGDERPVRVIFDSAHQDVDPKTKAPVGSRGPAAHMQESDLPDLEEIDDGDRLVIRGREYRIVVPKPDGHGTVLCRLQVVGS